ncbi:uncharacterized protein EDB93DRAFT_531534 [Suillus bovinus]|uniref:uncharacterized protein n=1 Tax=Suillus bovinus TaxID=48563 RepID=UPI001B875D3F|nr:uncharacterized protein EDB93DRAFT_531534 [Suillus bovinus]KAG2144706.1 hypothetical protein EDB93DRAFT_531534 [Suillus bovinus]
MDFLWSNMNCLKPLLGCITRLHPIIYPTSQRSWSRGIEPLSELERSQFLRHSVRVRIMTVSSEDDFHLLRSFPYHICVFSKLLSLSWMVVFTKSLRFFLSPTLRNCYIAIVQPDLARHSIGTRCAALEGLDIDTMGTIAQAPHLSETVRSCKALVRLQCPPLDFPAWKHLSTVPTLRDVSIFQESFSSPPFRLDTHNLESLTFLNVTTLRFSFAPITDITAIIQHSEFPSLKEFELADHVLPGAELLLLLRALSQCKACNTLEKISISDDDPEVQEPPGESFAVISELHCFTQLRTLRIYVRCSINLDNGLLFEAVSSWPQIRSLTLYDPYRRPPKVTFRGFFAVLSQCPYLQALHVGIDVVDIDINIEAESFQHTSLKGMSFHYSPAVNTEAVARIIFAMLPNVQLPEYDKTWDDVKTHLESLKASSSLKSADSN